MRLLACDKLLAGKAFYCVGYRMRPAVKEIVGHDVPGSQSVLGKWGSLGVGTVSCMMVVNRGRSLSR